MNTSGNLEGFSQREAHLQELIALGRGVSRKSDRITWHSEWIARSEKLSKKLLRVFSLQNRIESEGKEEEEEPWRIEFLEGTDFLGALMRRLNVREREREREREKQSHKRRQGARKKWNKTCNAWKCMNMLRVKINCIMGRNPIHPNSIHSV